MTDTTENKDIDPQFQADGTPIEKIKKKRGRSKNKNYLPWKEAHQFILDELIPSRGKYFEWYERHKPKAIPRFPYRVYTGKNEWVSWNHFLGTKNKFNEKIGRDWRPLDEAIVWAHSLKLTSQAEWMEWCRQEGNPPDYIPARPDLVYDQWRSWSHWLGNKPIETVEARQQAQRSAIYYILHELDVPSNVFSYGIEYGGISALKQRWEHQKFDLHRMFWYDPNKAETIKQIIEAYSVEYLGNGKQRVTPNVHEIVWHLQSHLELVTSRTNEDSSKQSPLPSN
jgi:hypothetical protein